MRREREIVGTTAIWPAVFAGVLILLASLAYVPSGWGALNNFDPPKRLLWAFLALALAGIWSVGKGRLDRAPLLLSFGLLAWMVLRTLLRPHPAAEVEVLFTWMLPVLLFISASGLNHGRGARIVGGLLLLAGLLQVVFMVLQRLGHDPIFFETTSAMAYKPERMVGTIGYQNQAVDFLALSAAGVLLVSRSFGIRLTVMVGLLLVAVLTGNRGGVLAFASALLVCQVLAVCLNRSWSQRKKWMATAALAVGLCGVGGAIVLVPETGGRFREVATNFRHSPAVASRMVMARVGWSLLRDRPWTGWGAGEYAYQYLERLGAVLPEAKTHESLRGVVFAREAHNDALQFAGEFGIIGILMAVSLLGMALASMARARQMDGIAIPSMSFILVYMAVSSLFSFPWQTGMAGPLAGLLLGWLWPQHKAGPTGSRDEERGMPRKVKEAVPKAGLLAMALVATGWFVLDARLNVRFPNALLQDGAVGAERLLPRWAYRYHALAGALYATQKDWGNAERELVHAETGFRDILLWNNLGHVYSKTGRWPEALKVYEKWARCGLNHSDALNNLSIACEQLGDVAGAAKVLQNRATLFPNLLLADVKRLAILQFKTGNYSGAEEILRRYSRISAKASLLEQAEVDNLRGAVALAQGNRDEAKQWFSSALKKNHALESARRNLSELE